MRLLQGRVVDEPLAERKDVEGLLVGFISALIEEQRLPEPLAVETKNPVHGEGG